MTVFKWISFTPMLLVAGSVLASEGRMIEEVVVTAQKTEQSAQDVGITMSVFSADDLEARRIESPLDLQGTMPNVNVKQIVPGLFPVVTIRGVGLNDFSANNNPTVGVYIDEVFLTSTNQLTFQLFDIQRVEVLKGPQGTLYGRNTTGGAINFVTAKPDLGGDSWDFSLTAGDYETIEAGFMYNKVLSDAMAIRLSGKSIQQGEGFYTSRTLGGEDIGSRDEYALRLQLAWQVNETTDVNIKLETSEADSEVGQFEHFGTQQPGVFPPAPCAAVLAGKVDPLTCADALGYSDPDGDPFTGDWNNDAEHNNKGQGITLTINTEVGPGTLSTVTGVLGFDRDALSDADSGPFIQAEFDVNDEISQITQEIRYAWSPSDSVDLIAGLFYSHDEVETVVPGDLSQLLLTRVLIESDQTTRSAAAFMHWDWFLRENLKFTGGVRLTREEKDFTGGMADLNPIGASCLLSPFCAPGLTGPVQLAFNDDSLNQTEPSFRLGLDYSLAEDAMLFASLSRGFKSGGFFGSGFVTANEQLEAFDSETLTAWEVGMKSVLLDGSLRFNAAAFYYDYEDIQTFTQVNTAALTILKLSNVDKAEIKGLEFDLLWKPLVGLEVQFGAGYLDTELGRFDAPGLGLLPSGNELPNAPKLSLNGLIRYEWEVGSLGYLSLQTDFNYSDKTYREAVNLALLQSDDYSLWNVRLGLDSANDRWSVALWGKNLGDEEYQLHAFDNGIGNGARIYGAPRTWGLTFTMRSL